MKKQLTILMTLFLFAPLSIADDAPLATCCAADDLLPPVRIQAGGEPIDTGKCIAHSGPTLIDLDRDGVLDLLVGDFSGHLHFYRNSATNEAPVYDAGTLIEAEGQPIRIKNW